MANLHFVVYPNRAQIENVKLWLRTLATLGFSRPSHAANERRASNYVLNYACTKCILWVVFDQISLRKLCKIGTFV